MTLWRDENEFLRVSVADDATFTFLDKRSGLEWRTTRVAIQEDGLIDIGHVWLRTGRSLCEQYPGRFRGEAAGDGVRFVLIGREKREMGAFSCRFALDGPWFECRITDVDQSLPTLCFPPPVICESLVIPHAVGKWVRKPMSERKAWEYPSHLNMRWFGGLKADNDHGWIAVLHEGFADSGALSAEMTMAPLWLQSLDQWTGERAVRYQFTTGGYVGLAKTFRDYAIQHGFHRTLRSKMEEFPATRNWLGGRQISIYQADTHHPERAEDRLIPSRPGDDKHGIQVGVTHAQAMEIIREAQSLGMRRGYAVVRGWITGGYDETHPDIWPPDPALGTIEELRALCEVGDPVTVALHDNYQDIYEQSRSWPRGANILRNGHPQPGGLWAGGQAYIINARDGLAYAKRNWPEIATLNPRAMFIDTTISVQFYESFEKGNELTRSQDLQLKRELLQFYRDHGQSLGSEEGADFGMDLVDWVENRHRRVAGESIPLWSLVFHDAAFYGRYSGNPYAEGGAQAPEPHWLTDMLWGYYLLYDFRPMDKWHRRKGQFGDRWYADDWHARIGADEMRSHRYLTEDNEVEETVFENGAIIVNFSGEERAVDGVSVGPGGYVIRD